jgi:DNA mismatch repair protein PMS2
VCRSLILKKKKKNKKSSVDALISKGTPGCGRSSADRQFFFVNNRPVDFPKFAKVANEIYKTVSRNQFPILVIQFIMNTSKA